MTVLRESSGTERKYLQFLLHWITIGFAVHIPTFLYIGSGDLKVLDKRSNHKKVLHPGGVVLFTLGEAIMAMRSGKMGWALVSFPPLHPMQPARKYKPMGLQPPAVLADLSKSALCYCMLRWAQCVQEKDLTNTDTLYTTKLGSLSNLFML